MRYTKTSPDHDKLRLEIAIRYIEQGNLDMARSILADIKDTELRERIERLLQGMNDDS